MQLYICTYDTYLNQRGDGFDVLGIIENILGNICHAKANCRVGVSFQASHGRTTAQISNERDQLMRSFKK